MRVGFRDRFHSTYTAFAGDLQREGKMTSGAKRVLVVEDDPVVAMVMEDTLRDMGLVVLVDLTLVDALSDLEYGEFDAALVDVGLRGESAHSLMLALRERHMPFAVVSGGNLADLAAEFPGVRMVAKPLSLQALRTIMRELLGSP